MKTTTKVMKYILDNSYAEKSAYHVVSGKRQCGKTTTAIFGAILKGLEAHQSKYRILIMTPTYAQELYIGNLIYSLTKIDPYAIKYKSQGHNIWLNIDEEEVFEIDVISSNSLDSVRGRDWYDFGIIEEINYCRNWKECLGHMSMMCKDFNMTCEAVL